MRMHNSSGSPDVEVKTAVTYAKHYRDPPAPGGFCMAPSYRLTSSRRVCMLSRAMMLLLCSRQCLRLERRIRLPSASFPTFKRDIKP